MSAPKIVHLPPTVPGPAVAGPGLGKTDLLLNLYRRRWWQFWKPRAPYAIVPLRMVAVYDPADLEGFLSIDRLEETLKPVKS